MIRLLRRMIRTASPSSLCAQRQTSFFSAIAPASEASSSASMAFPRKTIASETCNFFFHRRHTSAISADFSPSRRFFARRNLGFNSTAHSLAEHYVSKSPHSSSRQLIDHARSSDHGWLGPGAAIAALLLFPAAAVARDEKDRMHTSSSSAIAGHADVQHSAMENIIWTKVAMLSDSFSTSFASASEVATAMAFLAQCLNGVLLGKNKGDASEPVLGWKLRVASFVADLAGSSHSRRRALIQAGNGSIVDWLLDAVTHGEPDHREIQAEAARALSHFLSDDATCDEVLGRRTALSQLLRFAGSIQPMNLSTKSWQSKHLDPLLETDHENALKGRSMLLTALMEIVTSSCEIEKKGGSTIHRPKLSRLADATDISAALKVLQEESLCMDESCNRSSSCEDDIEKGPRMDKKLVSTWGDKALSSGEGQKPKSTTYLGASGAPKSIKRKQEIDSHGLWDDLHSSHVVLPLAAWAIATWAQASSANCANVAKLDKDGAGILACISAPEHSMKWHGAIAARLVVENGFDEAALSWSGALLEMAQQAVTDEDAELSLVALDALRACVQKSIEAQERVGKSNIEMLRDITLKISKNVNL